MPLSFRFWLGWKNQSADLSAFGPKIENDGQYGEDNSSDGRELLELGIDAAALGLAEKCFGAAADDTQTFGIALLENNQQDQRNTDQDVDYRKYDNACTHK